MTRGVNFATEVVPSPIAGLSSSNDSKSIFGRTTLSTKSINVAADEQSPTLESVSKINLTSLQSLELLGKSHLKLTTSIGWVVRERRRERKVQRHVDT